MKAKIKSWEKLREEYGNDGGGVTIKYGFRKDMEKELPPDRIVKLTIDGDDHFTGDGDWPYIVCLGLIEYVIELDSIDSDTINNGCTYEERRAIELLYERSKSYSSSSEISVDSLVKSIANSAVEEKMKGYVNLSDVEDAIDSRLEIEREYIGEMIYNDVSYEVRGYCHSLESSIDDVIHTVGTIIDGDNSDFNEMVEEKAGEFVDDLFNGNDDRLDVAIENQLERGIDEAVSDLFYGNDERLEEMVYSTVETIVSNDGSYASDRLFDAMREVATDAICNDVEPSIVALQEQYKDLARQLNELKSKKLKLPELKMPNKKVMIGSGAGLALTVGALIFKKVRG